MDDGSIVFKVDADDKDAQKKLERLQREIQKTEKAVSATTVKRNGIAESLDTARKSAEKAHEAIRTINEQMAENELVLRGKDSGGRIDFEEFQARKQAQEEMVYELKEQQKIYDAQVKQVGKLETQEKAVETTLKQQTQTLQQQRQEAGALTRSIAKQGGAILPKLRAQTQEIGKSLNKGFKNILKWGIGIRSAFILFKKLKAGIKEGVLAYAEYDSATKASIDGLKLSLQQLKLSWGAAFAPIVNAVAPLLQKLIAWLTAAADAVNQFFSALTGKKTYQKAVLKNTESTTENADSTKSLADSYDDAGEAAKEAAKEIMGFDEINRLSSNDTRNTAANVGGGTGGIDSDITGLTEQKTPITEEISTGLSKIVETVKNHLKELELFAYGMALGIGLILTLTGANIPLGLGLIAVGAIGLAKSLSENWDIITNNVRSTLGAIEMIVSGLMIGIGAVLLFSGANVPLGLGLLAVGAVTLASAVALNWEEIPANIRRVIADISLTVSGALLAVGAVLTFSGANIPLGLGMMAAGGLMLASAAMTNWAYISASVGNVVGEIGMILGGALLAVGAVILFATPSFSPLGLGLMIAGAATLAAAVAVNWDYISEKLRGTTGAIVAVISAALLALGVVLAFACPAALPLGIGLIIAGAAGLASAVAVNWDSIVSAVEGPLGLIMGFAGGALLALGLILCLSGGGIPLGIGMMAVGAASLATAAAVNWDTIVTTVGEKLGDIAAVAAAALLALGVILCLTGAAIPLGIGMIIAGGAALATAVAIKEDEIVKAVEGPLGRIMIAVGGALVALGIILCLTGVGIPLGLGMILAGGVTLATAVAPRWNAFTDAIKNKVDEIKRFLGIASPSTVFEEIGRNVVEGLINGIGDIATRLKTGLVDPIKAAFNSIHTFLTNFHLPKIKVPHLKVTWQSAGGLARFFGISSVPHLSVQWYAKGGIVDGATLIGAGEAGKEAIVPLERNTGWINMVADALIDRFLAGNRFADAITGMKMPAVAMGQVVPPMAVSGSTYGLSEDNIASLVNGIVSAFSGVGGNGKNRGWVININGREFMRATYDDFKAVENEHGISMIQT